MHTIDPCFFFIFGKNYDFWTCEQIDQTMTQNEVSNFGNTPFHDTVLIFSLNRLSAFNRECIQQGPDFSIFMEKNMIFLFDKLTQNEPK